GADPIQIVKNAFELYYLENHGAAFGILQGRRGAFILITVVVLVLAAYIYARLPFNSGYRLLRILIVFIASGAVGNFIDRVRQGYVVDFFYIKLINFPVFNVADIYVTVCVILLIIYLIFFVKEEMMDEIFARIFPWKKKKDK
ncbi:MAG: signal peptidase II, partial [Clostridiales bacterium]|nr:signal peptidase II [Clostridiales bacterium]